MNIRQLLSYSCVFPQVLVRFKGFEGAVFGEGSDGMKWLLLNVSNLRIRTKSLNSRLDPAMSQSEIWTQELFFLFEYSQNYSNV